MLTEEIKNIKTDEKECRKFGITVGLVLVIITFVLWYFDKLSYQYFSAAGGLLIIGGIIVPKWLAPLQKVWMMLSVVMGFVMSRVILTLLFYLVITPIGFIAKLSGKDFLDLKLNKEQESYWHKREEKEYSLIDTERQF